MPVRLRLLLAIAAGVGLPASAQTWQVPKPSPGLMPHADDVAHITAYVRLTQGQAGIQ